MLNSDTFDSASDWDQFRDGKYTTRKKESSN